MHVASKFSHWALTRPSWVLGALLISLALALPGLLRVRIDTDGRSLLPLDAPELAEELGVRERFGLADLVAVVVERPGANGVFEADALEFVARLTRTLGDLPGVGPQNVSSLANEASDYVVPGTLDFRAWLEPLPDSREELDRLRADLREMPILHGTLVSLDDPASATAILVRTPVDVERSAWIAELRAALAAQTAPSGVRVHVVGAPVVEAGLGGHILADLVRLLPLAIGALAAVFWLAFRCAPAVLIPAAEVLGALVVTLGALGWSGHPLQLASAVAPLLLVALGVTDEIHILSDLRRTLRESPELDVPRAVAQTMQRLAGALSLTSLTTAAGFGAFALSPIASLRAFGALMVVGALFCLAWSLGVTPVLLARTARANWTSTAPSRAVRWDVRIEQLFERVARRAAGARGWVVAATLLLAVAAVVSIRSLRVDDSWIGGFAPDSEVRRSTERVDELFGGAHLLQVAVVAKLGVLEGSAEGAAFRAEAPQLSLPHPASGVASPNLTGARLCVQPLVPGETQPRAELCAAIHSTTREGERWTLQLDPLGPSIARRFPSAATQARWRIDSHGRVLRSDALAALAELEQELARERELGVGRVVGLHEHLSTMHRLLRGRALPSSSIPPDQLDALLHHYRRVRGERALRQVLDSTGEGALATVFLRASSFERTAEVLARLRTFEQRSLTPLGLELKLGGDVALSQALVGRIVPAQLSSLWLAGGLVALLCWLGLRSARETALCLAPAAVSVLANFVQLAALDGALGIASSMFAALTLGVGVDYALHLIWRARALATEGAPEPVVRAAGQIAPALCIDLFAVGGAFGLLALSSTPSNARLGTLMLCGVAAALLATLILTPAGYAFGVRPRSS